MKSRALEHQVFYFPPDSLRDGLIVFPRSESRHLAGSLRLGAGDCVRATDGAGRFYDARVERTAGARVEARVLGIIEVPRPLPRITIFQGVVRPQRMDLLVEKAVELGCAGLVPVECERCVRRVAGPRLARWRRIASEAMKQSRRAHLADVFEPLDFDEAAGMAGDFDLVLLASEAPAVRPLKEVARAGPAAVALWVGPEGGFTDPEVEALMSAGAETFSLGAYRLRSETAALAALAAVGVLVATNSL